MLALVASPQGLLKHDLLASVHGYSHRYNHGGDNASLDRQFERDKEHLRALGIAVETLDSPLEPGNTQLTRYRISKDQLQVPGSLRFSDEELMLLRLAALAWREGSLSSEARRAMMKLESLGAGLDVQNVGVAPRIGISEPAAPILQRAIAERRVVTFAYQLPDRDTPLERRVAPLRLHRAEGRWHLIARDVDRDADRVFLLSRIVGGVGLTRDSYDTELSANAAGVVAELLEREARQLATIDVRRGTVAEARLSPRAEHQETSVVGPGNLVGSETVRLTIGTIDYYEHALAEEIAGYGADVTVVNPDSLRHAVIDRFRAVVAAHSDAELQPVEDESV